MGATSAASVLSASAIVGVGSPAEAVGLSAAVAVISGAVLVAAGLARLGFVTNFLAEPALVGFLFGMALTIIVRQLSKITGADGGDGDFFERLWTLVRHVSHWSLATLAVGLTALAVLLVLERFWPRLPAALLVLVVGLAVSAGAGLEKHGVEVVGKIPSAVPVAPLPGIPAADWLALAGGALGVALVVFAEAYSIAGRFAREHGQEVDADREMIAVGAANVAVGLVRGFAVSGSASRSAAAAGAGGRTPMVSLIAAALIVLTAAFLTPLFTDLPEAVLGAIVIIAVRGFLRVGELRRYPAWTGAACGSRSPLSSASCSSTCCPACCWWWPSPWSCSSPPPAAATWQCWAGCRAAPPATTAEPGAVSCTATRTCAPTPNLSPVCSWSAPTAICSSATSAEYDSPSATGCRPRSPRPTPSYSTSPTATISAPPSSTPGPVDDLPVGVGRRRGGCA